MPCFVVRSAPRVRDALLYEAKLLKAGLVVIGPVRRTITLIGGSAGSDVDMMTFLADRLPASCKIMLVSNNACSATRQGRSPRSQSNGQDFFAPPPSPVPPAPPTEIIREVYGQDEYGQQEFYLDELLLATDNFSPRRLIGEGGSGQVFVGMLPPGRCPQVESQGGESDGWGRGAWGEGGPGGGAAGGGAAGGGAGGGAAGGGAGGGGSSGGASGGCRKVAVKRLRWWGPAVADVQGAANARQFLAELRVLRRIRHPSLLGLLGVCATAGELLMVFDYLPNGSLETRLRDHTKPPLPWDLRMRIACEAATGLAFLHACRPPIIHRDVKAANVLLDAHMHALVSDFGLAKVASDQYTQPMAVTSIMGTRGYVAPEYVQTGLITAAIDVYAFGVILLELITGHVPFHPGRQPPNLSAWAIPIANNMEFTRLVDYRLEERYDPAQLQAVSMLAVLCLASNPKERPSMDQVVTWLRDWIRVRTTDQLQTS
ncbi:unnamed protein product [Closterium sp. Yama58-4]|nr:unnamed protein product [Closterium sp. Yama58-4]